MTAPTPNRLIHEKSPYLQQHAYNPVEWYPWGREAFEKARREDRPIFLSIGYSTCHWCHVMEQESFEDPDVAALMNREFVSIKVDREEHPDVDQVYMSAVQAMTGQGGWPLTAILTPDLQPFFGGTYFPKARRGSLPGMIELLPAIAQAWRTKRSEVAQSAEQLTDLLRQSLAATHPGTLSAEVLERAVMQAANTFDPTWGGFGGAPKFPRSHELSFLLGSWARTGSDDALAMVTTTLDRLIRGGIRDHLGGGFHRYSTDARWLVPHFEKMLYDQALIARTLLEAFQATGTEAFAQAARETFDYVLRDLAHPEGGFYTAEDADSEGEEGKCYVWRPEEILQVLGQEDGELVNRFYGVTAEGNFEHGTSILHVDQPLEGGQPAQRLDAARRKLLAVRSRRIRPHRDEKILTSWNGLMIASLAYGAAVLDEPRYLEAAARAAGFVLTYLRQDGRLLRRWRDGEAKYPGTLEDYAFLSYGLFELYEAGFDPRWLAEAKALADQMAQRFWDPQEGGMVLRDREGEPLIANPKEIYDGATPSGNSIAALVLLRLGRLTADQPMEARGRQLLETFAEQVTQAPFGYPQMLIAWDFALGPTQEIVIAGPSQTPDTASLLHVARQRFLPRAVMAFHPDDGSARQAIEAVIPWITSQNSRDGRPTAYVCESYICQLPTTDPATLGRLLQSTADPTRQ